MSLPPSAPPFAKQDSTIKPSRSRLIETAPTAIAGCAASDRTMEAVEASACFRPGSRGVQRARDTRTYAYARIRNGI
jgi:hypothetical protein